MTQRKLKSYELLSGRQFEKHLRGLERNKAEQVRKRLDNLLRDPYHFTKPGKAPDLMGKRILRAGKIRVIVAICEECLENLWQEYNCGPQCQSQDNGIALFESDWRKHIYD